MNSQENHSVRPSFHQEVLQINAGLHVLRQKLSANVPTDFEWSFGFDARGVWVTWNWRGDYAYQQELRGETAVEVLERLGAVRWSGERSAVRSLLEVAS